MVVSSGVAEGEEGSLALWLAATANTGEVVRGRRKIKVHVTKLIKTAV
jgi:hypothetical protein